MKVLGIDIGGTKIRFGIINESGEILFDQTIPTTFPLYETIEYKTLEIMEQFPEVEAIGVGTAGFVNAQEGKIVYATDTLPGWSGTDVKAQLEKATGKRVEVENDANCAALAEVKFGAAAGFNRVVCLTIGTGLGGGIILNGRVFNSPNGGAGEIGHMILYPHGHTCSCGRQGCFEQYVSGTALHRRIKDAGLSISPQELFIKRGDTTVDRIIESFVSDLAVVISTLQAAIDMDVVVIGGGVSESSEYWFDLVNEKARPLLLKDIDIKVASFGNESGILGAALLVLE